MKKFLFFALVLLIVPMSLIAQQTTLNFLYYIDATQAGYEEDQAYWQKFKDDNPDIDLQMEILFSQAYHQKLSAYIAAGQLPDVMYMWPTTRDSSALLHSQKLVKDLAPLLGKDFLSDFVAPALNVNAQASKMLAELPQSFTYTTVMYANKKLLSDLGIPLPKTYAALKAMVPKLRVKNVQTILLPDGDQWPAQSCLFSTVVGRMLGDGWIDKVNTGKVKFTDPAFLAALKFVQTMFNDGVINWSNIQQPYGDGPGLFAAGKAAFIIDGDWRQGAYLTDKASGKALIAPAAQATDFAFLNFPAIPGEINRGVVSAIAGVGLGISSAIPAGSDKEKAAVRLLKWYYGPEFSQMKLETGAFIPTRKGVTSEKLEPFTTMMPQYYSSIAKTCYVLDGVLDPSVFNVLNAGLQSIGLGAKTPAQVAAEMQKAMDAWLKSKM
jgi:raffinose/stachyose/melibiose transport system substrate-binding protein